jgi:hypothetical protein
MDVCSGAYFLPEAEIQNQHRVTRKAYFLLNKTNLLFLPFFLEFWPII